jgi:cellulose synthase/poly-beta-1,6-N-acetylglucosamine synthase-like glycosyltransferase
MAPSVIYVAFYAFVSLFSKRSPLTTHPSDLKPQTLDLRPQPFSFLILFPAYQEDKVIVHSVHQCLKSTYPQELYHIVVISDHMTDETNDQLQQLPITLFTPQFEKSSKAKALHYALEHTEENYDYVIILDADNVVLPDFLEQVNASCQQGHRAIQCHRCAKNSDNDVAVLDGISEEINNTLFRKAHNRIGISSALIGSGMCFEYEWFKNHVGLFETAVEDREMEILLMKENIFIKYEEHIPVYDEKVSNPENFQRQRLRWMTGQVQSLLLMLPYLSKAVMTGNIHYIDKTMQQALIPRSILLVLTFFFSVLMTIVSYLWSIKWWVLFLVICLSIYIAIPRKMRNSSLLRKIFSTIKLVWLMLTNILKMDLKSKEFLHTTHDKKGI